MSWFGDWVARSTESWLERFRQRHALGSQKSATAEVAETLNHTQDNQRTLLHVGCGYATLEQIPLPAFRNAAAGWREIRLDADANVGPDIVGTMTDMSDVPDGFAEAIFSSHGIEHLYWHDVPRALAEFRRVLAEDGIAIITCPDVQTAAQMIAEDRMFETAYISPAGPITPFDILYSYRPFVEANPQWMSHHCGFTLTTLTEVLRAAGFASVQGVRRLQDFDLWLLASKSPRTPEEMALLAHAYLPLPG